MRPIALHVVRGQQQLHVAGAATLRQLDEPFGDARCAGDANGFERLQAFRRRVAIRRRAQQRALGVAQLLLFDHALELEPPQIAEHRARLCGEPIGLGLQGADPPLRAFGLIAVGVGWCLRHECRDQARERDGRTSARSLIHADYTESVRVLGIDYGARRIGLALSDATATLASPWRMLQRPPSEAETLRMLITEIMSLKNEDDGLEAVVVGWPRRLDGSPNDQTPVVQTFAQSLKAKIDVPVILQDERLTSTEAEARLARREKDWRKRKQQLDAAAAAIILQDYLDGRPDRQDLS